MSSWGVDPLGASIWAEREEHVARRQMERQGRAVHQDRSEAADNGRQTGVFLPFWQRVVRNLRAVV